MGKNLFQETFNDRALEEALSYLEEKKNSCGVDGMYLSELWDYWKINRSSLLSELERGTYELGMVRIREILSREGKRRRISLFNSIDRLLLRCLSQSLQRYFEPQFHENCFAFREGLGVAAAVSRMVEYIRAGYC